MTDWSPHDQVTFLPMCLERAEKAREAGDEAGARGFLRDFYMVRYLDRPALSYMGYAGSLVFERWMTADRDIATRAREAGVND